MSHSASPDKWEKTVNQAKSSLHKMDQMRVDIKKSIQGGKGPGKFKALLKKELESQRTLFNNISEMKEGYEKRVDTESLSEQLIQRRTHDSLDLIV